MLEFASVWVSFCFPLYFFWGILSEKKDFDNCVLKRTPLFSHLLTFSAFEEMKERLLEEMETQKALRLEIEELDQTASKYAELKKRHEQEITKMQNKVGRGGLRMHVCAYECACCCVNDLNSLWSPPPSFSWKTGLCCQGGKEDGGMFFIFPVCSICHNLFLISVCSICHDLLLILSVFRLSWS